jgi:hypothetical protein
MEPRPLPPSRSGLLDQGLSLHDFILAVFQEEKKNRGLEELAEPGPPSVSEAAQNEVDESKSHLSFHEGKGFPVYMVLSTNTLARGRLSSRIEQTHAQILDLLLTTV